MSFCRQRLSDLSDLCENQLCSTGSLMKERFLTKPTKDTKLTNRMISRSPEKFAGKAIRISRKDAKSAKERKEIRRLPQVCVRRVISGLANW